MADASNLQTNFLGGEWSPNAQGRADDPVYRAAMSVCLNGYPTEEGSWVRRPGTKFCAYTRGGARGKLYRFQTKASSPYQLEFTDGHLRFFLDGDLVAEEGTVQVLALSSASPAVLSVAEAQDWTDGDELMLMLALDAASSVDVAASIAGLLHRTFFIKKVTTTTFSLYDSVTGAAVDGSLFSVTAADLVAARVLDLVTPYTEEALWSSVRGVQDGDKMFLLSSAAPLTLSLDDTTTTGAFASFSIGRMSFIDGPYLDPPVDGAIITPSATSGVITLTISYPNFSSTETYHIGDRVTYSSSIYRSLADANIDLTPSTNTSAWALESTLAPCVGVSGFQSGDIGRLVRLFSEPLAWGSTVSYVKNDLVKYDDGYYICLKANSDVQPDSDVTYWILTTSVAAWTWAQITSIVAENEVRAQIRGKALLYTNACTSWRLGAYSDTTGWPTCGVYAQGRVWLAGAIDNRFDASMSNGVTDNGVKFSPTGVGSWADTDEDDDGTVAGNNGMSFTLNASDRDPIYWMTTDHNGVVMGTRSGEWVIQASNLNEPITPTSIQAHKMTRYGCEPVEPIRAGLSLLFVQRQAINLIEYISDVYSGKYSGTNLSARAKHLTSSGLREIAYQQNPSPVVWARTDDGGLLGCTYKRESPFGTQPASFYGWHQHALGSGNSVISIQQGVSEDGDVDTVMLVTEDSVGVCQVEMITQEFPQSGGLQDAWFLDGAIEPTGAMEEYVGSIKGIRFYGLLPFAGKTISAFCGSDLGDVTVDANGTVFVPYTDIFSESYLASVSAG